MTRMPIAAALAAFLALAIGPAAAQQKVDQTTFGTNWVAQAEHGGYYQAVADGTYKKHNLEVKIIPGGPQANNRMLLPVGRIDFYMGGNMIQAFSAVQENIPTVVVAAIFQKDPQVLIAHPGQGFETFADLKNSSDILVAKEGLASYYQWMKSEYGFKEEQTKPYNFNPAPFLANKKAVQQGYLTSEPATIEKAGGFKPVVPPRRQRLLDLRVDNRDAPRTRREEPGPRAAVRRCLDHRLVQLPLRRQQGRQRADQEGQPRDDRRQDRVLDRQMKQYGIVDSGDTAKLGIGAMTDARMKDFFDKMVKAGLFPASVDYKKSYTTQFVNKGVGRS